MARTRLPTARGFTVAEKRSVTFERIALYAVFLVAIIAAAISFQALMWVGTEMGLAWAAALVPIAVDGFAIACSVGVIRSQASGEPLRQRLSEWLGISGALGLSIAGNVTHALDIGTGRVPDALTIAVSAAVPVIVAYGIHVYGRAMVRGISAHVLASDPSQLHFDLAHLGDAHDERAQQSTPARVARKAARETTAQPPRATIEPARTGTVEVTSLPFAKTSRTAKPDLEQKARALFDAAVATDPTEKPDAKAIHDTIESPQNVATTRRWVALWWKELTAERGEGRVVARGPEVRTDDPTLEQQVREPVRERLPV
ncbi:MAG: DUF2637 domain-containing protein [Phycicoccus sp.]